MFYQQTFFFSHTHISLDVLKTRHREKSFIQLCLTTGQKFVIDNTNPSIAERKDYIAWAKEKGFVVSAYFFVPDFQRSMEYNRQRLGKRCVPDVAIKSTIKKLEEPLVSEGFEHIFYVSHNDNGGFDVKRKINDAF